MASTVTVSPLTFESSTFGHRRIVPLSRIARIQAALPMIAGVHIDGGPFRWGQAVPVGLGQKEALVRAVLSAQRDAPVMPTLVVQWIGGHGLQGLTKGQEYLLFFAPEGIQLQDDSVQIAIPYSELTSLEIGGPGETTTNLGVIGGGFGLAGAIAGMAISAAANALTTQTTVDTMLAWTTSGSEVILHTSSADPSVLRVELSEQLAQIEQRKRPNGTLARTDVAAQLTELASLRTSGVLSEDEFARAKMHILGPEPEASALHARS